MRSGCRVARLGVPDDFEYVAVAQATGVGDLEQLTETLKLKGYVTFEGEVAHDRLPAIYQECNAFLLGSYHEAQCMALLEAMSCGLPWAGPMVGAVSDLVEMGANETPTGIVFDHRFMEHDTGLALVSATVPADSIWEPQPPPGIDQLKLMCRSSSDSLVPVRLVPFPTQPTVLVAGSYV